MNASPELFKVEKPFLDQLDQMGWKTITGTPAFPTVSGRAGSPEGR